jgi:pimeloyl-ACP methyl ester carboxylesterase
MSDRPNIVLVHGAWADGSSWSAVIERLQADGFRVTAPQFPLTSLADDVARLRQVLELQDGPNIVAGHSYGGQIVTSLGGDAPNVAGSRRSVWTRASRSAASSRKGRRPLRSPISSPTSAASGGSPRTTSWATSPPTSTRRGPG